MLRQRASTQQLQQQLLIAQATGQPLDTTALQPQVQRKRKQHDTVPSTTPSIGEDFRYIDDGEGPTLPRDYLGTHHVMKIRKDLDYPKKAARLVKYHHGGLRGPQHRLHGSTLPLPQPNTKEQPIRLKPFEGKTGMIIRPVTDKYGNALARPEEMMNKEPEALPLIHESGFTYTEPKWRGLVGLRRDDRHNKILVALYHYAPASLEALRQHAEAMTLDPKNLVSMVLKFIYVSMARNLDPRMREVISKEADVDVDAVFTNLRRATLNNKQALNSINLSLAGADHSWTQSIGFAAVSGAVSLALMSTLHSGALGSAVYKTFIGSPLLGTAVQFMGRISGITSGLKALNQSTVYEQLSGFIGFDQLSEEQQRNRSFNVVTALGLSSMVMGMVNTDSLGQFYTNHVQRLLQGGNYSRDQKRQVANTFRDMVESFKQVTNIADEAVKQSVERSGFTDVAKMFAEMGIAVVQKVKNALFELVMGFFRLISTILNQVERAKAIYTLSRSGQQSIELHYRGEQYKTAKQALGMGASIASASMTAVGYVSGLPVIGGVASRLTSLLGGAASALPILQGYREVKQIEEKRQEANTQHQAFMALLTSQFSTILSGAGGTIVSSMLIYKTLVRIFGTPEVKKRTLISLYASCILPSEGYLTSPFGQHRHVGITTALDRATTLVVENPDLIEMFPTSDLIATFHGLPHPSSADASLFTKYTKTKNALRRHIMKRVEGGRTEGTVQFTPDSLKPQVVYHHIRQLVLTKNPQDVTSEELAQILLGVQFGLGENEHTVMGIIEAFEGLLEKNVFALYNVLLVCPDFASYLQCLQEIEGYEDREELMGQLKDEEKAHNIWALFVDEPEEEDMEEEQKEGLALDAAGAGGVGGMALGMDEEGEGKEDEKELQPQESVPVQPQPRFEVFIMPEEKFNIIAPDGFIAVNGQRTMHILNGNPVLVWRSFVNQFEPGDVRRPERVTRALRSILPELDAGHTPTLENQYANLRNAISQAFRRPEFDHWVSKRIRQLARKDSPLARDVKFLLQVDTDLIVWKVLFSQYQFHTWKDLDDHMPLILELFYQ